ncbi:MAG: tRNA preQ1(34) S-adenosylmethionine ribosyltransferase-isomerase QueA [Planctomycetota bacterium]|nr:tRNA preQ1(34) S-adenosylmethionine ribosyltransferase-isomerase QueA [Planctomycetota bacterium]
MHIDELDYHLPPELIAQVPADRPEDARLLAMDRATGALHHRFVQDLPDLLHPGDLVIANDTRVLPARLYAVRDTGGHVEIFLLEEAGGGAWRALVRSGGSLRSGEELMVQDDGPVRLVTDEGSGQWVVEGVDESLEALMTRAGRMPLPPYIRREPRGDDRDALDRERYQTVYASRVGAVAAPTAGLHLSSDVLELIASMGAELAHVTLHVGLGTFAPVRAERITDHTMHPERYEVSEYTAEAIRAAKRENRRVVCVGTTTVRALEGAAALSDDGLPRAGSGHTDLFVTPGFEFRVVDALLTNFHLPRSTLIALVGAFAGLERLLAAYRLAVEERYRFYSYGDAMFIS